jgi:Metallo-peptidase family M12
MMWDRAIFLGFLLACLAWLQSGPADAQAHGDSVRVILSNPADTTSPFRQSVRQGAYDAIRQRAGSSASVQVLPLTRTEVWSVPRGNVTAVRTEAQRHNVAVELVAASPGPIIDAKAAAAVSMSATQKQVFDQARASLAAVGIKMMQLPSPPIMEYALSSGGAAAQTPCRMTIELKAGEAVTITGRSVEKRDDLYVFRGTVDGTGAPATLMWWADGKMVGTVQHAGHTYVFRHMGGVVHAVVEINMARMPQEHAPMPARLRDPDSRDDPLVRQGDASMVRSPMVGVGAPTVPGKDIMSGKPAGSAEPGTAPADVVIDVLVAYTRKAAANYADIKREVVQLAIEEGNEAFRNSGLGNIKLRLVHAYQTDYIEDGEHFDHVWRFADKGDGYMEEVHALRDRHKADVAVLVVDDARGCGLATRVYADADEAFAVVHHDCAALTYSLAHEIGHIIGARHEPTVDKSTMPFPYGHGYVAGTKWRDIMSYRESCAGCPRMPVWSNPRIMIKGEPAGTAEQDNARVIAEQAARVAAFR